MLNNNNHINFGGTIMAKEKKSHKGLRMTDSMKQKYAQLFLDELDT